MTFRLAGATVLFEDATDERKAVLAAVLKEFNQLVLEDVPTPTPGPGQAIVGIKSCGFCAIDFKAIKAIRQNVKFPFVPGHEPAGIGAGVTNVKEGDEVIMQPSGYCGSCHYCRLGLTCSILCLLRPPYPLP